MASEINSAGLCLDAVQGMETEVANARKTLMNAETCIVNRAFMQAQLKYLRDNLPETLVKAAEIVKEEQQIRREVEEKKESILNTANADSQRIHAEADQYARAVRDQAAAEAQAMGERAANEANACVEAARAEANRILVEAEKKAQQLVEQENIVRRARVESDELREQARQECGALRKNTLDFVDGILGDADRAMTDLLNSVRQERGEVRNRM